MVSRLATASGQARDQPETYVNHLTYVRSACHDSTMTITASRLRANVYKVLDEVLETGTPVEIARRGQRLRIVPVAPASRLDRLVRRPRYLKVDADDIVHLDWSDQWRP